MLKLSKYFSTFCFFTLIPFLAAAHVSTDCDGKVTFLSWDTTNDYIQIARGSGKLSSPKSEITYTNVCANEKFTGQAGYYIGPSYPTWVVNCQSGAVYTYNPQLIKFPLVIVGCPYSTGNNGNTLTFTAYGYSNTIKINNNSAWPVTFNGKRIFSGHNGTATLPQFGKTYNVISDNGWQSPLCSLTTASTTYQLSQKGIAIPDPCHLIKEVNNHITTYNLKVDHM